ncbi:hypothetical protein [uncultured Psychrobacter sp.]|uniref:hypothetical protein n=1 Tax=uncultured Psychrobacter sp. TaxID=259303 RepID=UPI00345826D4
MFAVIVTIIIIWICMWGFYKFMYPRAPKSMMPKEGDVTTLRQCNFCGNHLAEYRGVVENRSIDTAADKEPANNELFFCNYEHQADFHAGKTYQ